MRPLTEPEFVPCEGELDDALTDRLLVGVAVCGIVFYLDVMLLAISLHKHWTSIRDATLCTAVALGVVLLLAVVWITRELRKEALYPEHGSSPEGHTEPHPQG